MQVRFLDGHTDSRLNILEDKLKEDIQSLKRNLFAKGVLGGYCKRLSDLIVKYLDDCSNQIKVDIFNKIKSEKILPIPQFHEIKGSIEERTLLTLKNQISFFEDEVGKIFPGNKNQVDKIIQETSIEKRCLDNLKVLYNDFESEFNGYISKRKNEETVLREAQEANKIARKANSIAKSSKIAAWISGCVAVLALIFSLFPSLAQKFSDWIMHLSFIKI